MSRVDSTDYSTVAVCELCQWRALAPTAATGWKLLAVHLKQVHDDSLAARRASEAMRKRISRLNAGR